MTVSAAAAQVPATLKRRRFALFSALALVVVVIDQVTKSWVDGAFKLAWSRSPTPGLADPTPVLGDLVRIAKSYNEGGLFGLFDAAAPVLAAASVVVVGLLIYIQVRGGGTGSWASSVAFGLLLGGAVGNLLDRMRLGFVVDFVDMGIGEVRWFAFNVADAAISLAIVALFVTAFWPRPVAGGDGVGAP